MLRPVVVHRGKRRKGKGFSLGELKAVGLSLREAKKMGISFDKRRKSVLEENVKMLEEVKRGRNL